MLLFIGVAVALYVLFTKPAAVPGRRSSSTTEHPVSYTPIPGTPTATKFPGDPATDDSTTAAHGASAAPEAQE
jgi:hypothetical protein